MQPEDRGKAAWEWALNTVAPLQDIYVDELYWLAVNIETSTQKLFDDMADLRAPGRTNQTPNASEEILLVDPDVHTTIRTLLGEAARARALLHARQSKGPNQSASAFELHKHRVKMLNDLLLGLDTSELKSVKTRNALEHYDEYIDDVIMKLWSNRIPRPAALLNDLIVSSRRMLGHSAQGSDFHNEGRQPFPLRLYVIEERVYESCGHGVSLQALHDQAGAIARRLREARPDMATANWVDDARGASFILVGD